MHRVAERLIAQRTALSNQTRGLLAEYGLSLPLGRATLRKSIPTILEDAENELSMTARFTFNELYQELIELDQRVDAIKERINAVSKENRHCQRLMTIPGVGPMVATAVISMLGDAHQFKNGREFAAFPGLVPRQYSTGGKTTLKGISKRGDRRTRMLLVQGTLAALNHSKNKPDKLNRWAYGLKQKKCTQIAAVALANKLARICWALTARRTEYRASTI
jgi:transposase